MAEDCNDAQTAAPRWQFSLRELLFVTVVVSLHLAAFAILFQYIDSSKSRYVLFWLAGGIGGLISVSILAVIERIRAGRPVVKLRTHQRRTPLVASLVPSIVLACSIIFDHLLDVSIEGLLIIVVVVFLPALIMSVVLSGVILLAQYTLLCEKGIIQDGLYFCPWSRIRNWPWTLERNRLTIGRGLRRCTVVVPPEEQATVEALLKKKLG